MPIYESDSDNDTRPRGKLFGRQRPIHAILGGGKAADVLLWRVKKVSAALLIGITVIWLLFEVFEYNFVTLLCHVSITAMLVVFIWRKGAEIFKWTAPNIPEIVLRDSTLREAAWIFHAKFNQCLAKLLYVACGNDPKLFILAIISLWLLSVIGNYISSVNLLFFGLLCLETLPFLYERYEKEVDYLAGRTIRRMRKMYKNLYLDFLERIPRRPVKEN